MTTPIRTKLFTILAICAFMAGLALGHGDKKHVMGTLEKINADSIVVKTAGGKSIEVKLIASTVYFFHAGSTDKPAKLSDLAVGNRVVIHATPKGETLEANEVKFSSAPPAAAKAKS
jgi:hypothetical protein